MALPDSAKFDEKVVAESLAAVSAAVSVETIDLGTLDDAAYDRTILLLLTGAPDPALAAAPSGAVSPVLRQVP
jgi:hypothetical protein